MKVKEKTLQWMEIIPTPMLITSLIQIICLQMKVKELLHLSMVEVQKVPKNKNQKWQQMLNNQLTTKVSAN